MHNVWLIAKREYLERVRTKAFLVATILIPTFLGGGIFAVTNLLARGRAGSHIALAAAKPQTTMAYVLFFLMYMVVLMYGMNVARSIIEEKTSRIFEVLLATIKPSELLAGKILGVGSVGLTQVGIWMLAAALLAALAGSFGAVSISLAQTIFFIVYFALGYALYSSVAAALGAMTNSEQELQQLNMFLMMPLFFCMLMIIPVASNPNSLLARVVSQIPFCAPLLMNFRISLSMPHPWEIALSIALILITIFAVLSISARIYRVGILMYGKKPNLKEMLRWMKYS
jgi:ABC-2 type transport system permease protein